MKNSKDHWERIYTTKQPHEVSWTQHIPATSLTFLQSFSLAKNSAIIDIGGGESQLVDYLLDEGYADITVLDISEQAILHTKERLGARASAVEWIVTDVTNFVATKKYDVWHDRATFHFLTTESQISKYVSVASNFVTTNGYLIIGTFSEKGPLTCSGLDVKQYSEQTLHSVLKTHFKKIRCIIEDHLTPFHTLQNFLFCSFRKK